MKCIIHLSLLTLAGTVLMAPNTEGQFIVDWFTLDSGGGTSTGGAYAVSGTIGQPDAGHLTGSNFTLESGFWSVLQDSDAPWLRIRLSGASVVLSWPSPSTSFQLQQTSALKGPATAWTDLTQTPALVNGNKEVTLLVAPDNGYFRLRKP